MAAPFLLWQGRVGALKTGLQLGVLRGLTSTVPLSTKSGKSEQGLPPNPKKQSPPKNVVEPKVRGKLLASDPAAGLSKKFSPPTSHPSVMNKGKMVASPDPDDVMLLTDKGGPRFLARKTLVEFPQKVVSPLRKQGSDLETHQGNRKAVEDSSSSSSSSSDSESDEEELISEAGSQAVSKAQGQFAKSDASFDDRTPKVVIAAKERTWSQVPCTDSTYPEKPYQPEKKTKPQSEVDEGVMKKYGKEKQMQKGFRLNEIDNESQKTVKPKQNLTDHTESGLSAQPSPMPTLLAKETRAEKLLQAAPSETREKNVEEQVPEPKWKVASPQFKKEDLGKQVVGNLKAAPQTKQLVLEDQVPVGSLKTVPAENKDVFDEKIPVLNLEEKGEIIQDSATLMEDPDHMQETEQAALPAEPFDNTTYKNLQHHDYTMYTFLDLNLDLSKFRMPQPASGRESPRH